MLSYLIYWQIDSIAQGTSILQEVKASLIFSTEVFDGLRLEKPIVLNLPYDRLEVISRYFSIQFFNSNLLNAPIISV
jgi:hypothetical protein